jgi:cell division protein FtsX
MSLELLRHVFYRSMAVLARQPVAALLSVVLTAVCLYGLVWIGFAVLRIPQVFPGWLTSGDAVIYLRTEASPEAEQRAAEALKALPEIDSARFVSKGDAHGRLEKQLGLWKEILAGMGQDYLQSSVEITLQGKFRSPELRDKAIERMRLIPDVAEVLYGKGEGEEIKVFLGWAEMLGWASAGLFLMVSIGLYWSVAFSMKLSSQDEIHVLACVGAPKWLICLPFFLIVWLVGALGSTIALTMFMATLKLLEGILPLPLAALFSIARYEWILMGALLFLISTLLGCLGVWFALSWKRDWLGHDLP